jgi:hypothetical protein
MDGAGALVFGFLDAVGVVPGALDDSRVGAVPALGVEVPLGGNFGHDGRAGLVRGLRGGKAGPMARRTMRTVRVNLTRPGSMSASVAAWQIRAEME